MPSDRSKDACFDLSLMLCMILKRQASICSQFSKIAIFEKIVKIQFLKKCQLFKNNFSVFSTCSHNEFG